MQLPVLYDEIAARSRDGGCFCTEIEAMAPDHDAAGQDDADAVWDGVVWGNHDAVTHRLEELAGPSVPLAQWLRERSADKALARGAR